MVADRSQVNDIYMTVEQYLALDEATDAKYEYDNGYVFMLRPPSSAYDESAILDMAGGSNAHAALCAQMITAWSTRAMRARSWQSGNTSIPI